jgi:hypothetical protein
VGLGRGVDDAVQERGVGGAGPDRLVAVAQLRVQTTDDPQCGGAPVAAVDALQVVLDRFQPVAQ